MIFSDLIGEDRFAQGVMRYQDFYEGDYHNTRIVVDVALPNTEKVSMIVDTGAPWCVLDPEDAEAAQPGEPLGIEQLYVRGSLYIGFLYRIPITLKAIEGADITIEATFFVPQLRESEDWLHPNFLGLSGFLERIRFAVDPEQNYFYFGQSAAQPAVADA